MDWPEFVYPFADVALRLRSIALAPKLPLQRGEGFRPFFIVGSGRCGTTLLRRMLQAGGQVHIPHETYMIGPAIRFFRRNRDRAWSQLVRNVLAMFEYQREFDRFGISLRPLAHRLLETAPGRRSLAVIIDALFRYHAEQHGLTFERWGDKTPLNSYALEPILATFPDARFVHLVRDGVDVVQSLREGGFGYDLPGAARRWTSTIAAVQRFARRHPRICTELRYEQLVNMPDAVVRGVCAFLDMRFDPAMITSLDHEERMTDVKTFDHHANVFKPVSGESVGKGRREMPAEERRALQRLIGRELELLGYDPAA